MSSLNFRSNSGYLASILTYFSEADHLFYVFFAHQGFLPNANSCLGWMTQIKNKCLENDLFHTQALHFLFQRLNKHLIKKWPVSCGSNNMRMSLSESGPAYKTLTALESHTSSSFN